MFDWFALSDATAANVSEPDAVDLLKSDHDSVKELFERFKKSGDPGSRVKIVKRALTELKIHAVLEEIFYPAVR